MKKKIFDYLEANEKNMFALWKKIVNMDSGTYFKDDIDVLADFLYETITSMGGNAEIHSFTEAGNMITASFGKKTDKAPIAFMGHIDTVFSKGTVAKRPFKIENGKVTGPGSLDMKGGLVMQLYVAKALVECGYDDREIVIVFTGDEESGHPKSTAPDILIEKLKPCAMAINFETGDINGELIVGRKGSASYKMTVTGVSVHAGREPENGRSAVLEIAHKIIDIHNLTDFSEGVTYNVGTVSGGIASNAVPDHATISIDVRVLNMTQLEEADKKIKKIAEKTYIEGTSTVLEKAGGMPPMEKTENNMKLFEYVKQVSAELGFITTDAIISGGGSDSSYSVAAGVPTIDQMGVKGQWNHSDREYALESSLLERAKLAAACVLDFHKIENKFN